MRQRKRRKEPANGFASVSKYDEIVVVVDVAMKSALAIPCVKDDDDEDDDYDDAKRRPDQWRERRLEDWMEQSLDWRGACGEWRETKKEDRRHHRD